jgi:DNA replication protein DnaC
MTSSSSAEDQAAPCPICKGLGFLQVDAPVGHADFGKVVPCSCQQDKLEKKRLHNLRAMSNLEEFSPLSFENFLPQGIGLNEERRRNLAEAFQLAQKYAENPEGWLILLGGYGSGKTHLASAIANRCLARGMPTLFLVVPDLLDYLRVAFNPNSEVTFDERFNQIRQIPLLILDDLGAQSATPWAQEKLYQILNSRYNLRLPTVITSNHRLEDIDIRIRSRLVDPDLTRVATILAPDFRRSGIDQTGSELSTLSMHSEQRFSNFDMRQNELEKSLHDNLKRVFEQARSYAQKPEDWLFLMGGYGSGKTHLAAAIANEVMSSGNAALFVVVPDLLDYLRAAYNPNSPIPLDKRFEEVKAAPLLVLDDLGTESATPWAREKLFQLLNYRYNGRLPTVFTGSNAGNIDERLKARLFDVGRCTVFEILAPSYRGSAARRQEKQSRIRSKPKV